MSNTYEEEFNKQLADSLRHYRITQPNHIPVYSMKYKNASKYLIENLEQSLGLFPKKFKLQTVYEIIQTQSKKFCLEKLKDDKKIKEEGQDLKIPPFFLYTIQIDKELEQKSKQSSSSKQSQNNNRRGGPIGKFVKLNPQLTYGEAFEKYGRHNCLTIVYTDTQNIYRNTQKIAQSAAEKWLTRILIFILALVLIPYLMKDSENKFETTNNFEKKENQRQRSDTSFSTISPDDVIELQGPEELNGMVSSSQEVVQKIESEKRVNYDDDI